MVDAHRLSDDFAKKAESDLELAQHISMVAMSGHRGKRREPGLALGTCMYHAQQAMEKGLKSVVLLLDEILGVPRGDGNALLAKCLKHPIYPEIYNYYSGRLGRLLPAVTATGYGNDGRRGEGAAAPARLDSNLFRLCRFWDRYSKNYELRLISWKRSVGIGLEDWERRDLDSESRTYAGMLASLTDQDHAGSLLDGPAPMIPPHDCLDAGALRRRRARHARRAWASGLSTALDREFRKCQTAAQTLSGDSHTARDAHIRTVRRAMLDFGLALLLCHSVTYMALLPHNTLGRYPQWLGEYSTTDLYGRQAWHVLHHLFVGVPHDLGRLSDYSGSIDSMWEAVAEP